MGSRNDISNGNPDAHPDDRQKREDRDALVRLLGELPPFQGLAPELLAEIATHCRPENARSGRVIYRQGERADSLYVVDYGLLRVTALHSGKNIDLGDVRKGDACGWSALTGVPARTDTVTARSPSRVWRLKSQSFHEILERHPDLALSVARAVWEQFEGVVERLGDPDARGEPRANLRTIILDLEAQPGQLRALVLALIKAVYELPGRRGDLQVLYDAPELELPDLIEAEHLAPVVSESVSENISASNSESVSENGPAPELTDGRIFALELPPAASRSDAPEALIRLMSWLQTEERHIEQILAFSFRPSPGLSGGPNDSAGEDALNAAAAAFQRELIRNSDRSIVLTDMTNPRADLLTELIAPDGPDRVRVYLLDHNDEQRNATDFRRLSREVPETHVAPILFHAQPEHLSIAAAGLAAALFGQELGLALGGGGAKCAAHIGVLQVLEEEGIPVHVLSSSSSGSVIAALWAAGHSAAEIEKIYAEAVLSPRWKFPQWTLPLRGSVARGKHGERFLESYLGKRRTYDALRPVLPGAVDLKRGRDVVIRGTTLKAAALASQAIPGFLPLVEHDGMQLADCALANNVPASMLKHYDAGAILGVNISPAPEQTEFDPGSVTSNLLRSVEVMMHQTTSRHLEYSDLEIRPDVGRYALTDFSQTREYIRLGREAMQEKMSGLKLLLARRFGYND